MARRSSNSLIFDSLLLEGGLFAPAILEKAARGEHSAQLATDYQLPQGLSLSDEQGRAFRIASALWKNFEAVRVRQDVPAAKVTAGFALEFLRDALGFSDIKACSTPVELADRTFPITAFAIAGRVPVVVAPHNLDLDVPDERFVVLGSGARRRSACQLAQQFLNASAECTWAILTNGRQLRLVRDADTLTRPAFLEADLEYILRDQRYADFAAVWRLLHSSRAGDSEISCIWEAWRREGQEQGEPVREGLRNGVTDALLALGNGFLQHAANDALRSKLQSGELTKDAYFQQLLRLIYRCLFVFTVEERGLLHVPDQSPAAIQAQDIYQQGYAFRRLRDRALRRTGFDRHSDLWASMLVVFRGLGNGEASLAIPALGGLFTANQCPDLDRARLANRSILTAMRHLRWAQISGKLAAIDYRNMGSEELGSVYESLLELVPTVDLAANQFGFVGITESGRTGGNARKISGSYYTPDSLVQVVLDSALDPIIEQRLAASPDQPAQALLSITVIDPACGSGHFLLAAARRLAEKLAELRASEGAVRPEDYRHALRAVASHCLYGVDRNPMAVELCRLAIWLETVDLGKPLSFLDNHIRFGDSLVGVMDLSVLKRGVPDGAFDPCEGDEKTLGRAFAKRNRQERFGAQDLFAVRDSNDSEVLARMSRDLDAIPDDSPELVRRKKELFEASHRAPAWLRQKQACDLWTAAFFQKLTASSFVITSAALADHLGERPIDSRLLSSATTFAIHQTFFHWPLEFPEVFASGGFDVILSNPPWERIKLQEQEFFSARDPRIAAAPNKASRGRLIKELAEKNPTLHAQFIDAVHSADCISKFLRYSGRFPLTATGDINTYAVFAETIRRLLRPSGRSTVILPTGIATDSTCQRFFVDLNNERALASLFDFENRGHLFAALHTKTKFCLITLSTEPVAATEMAFFCQVIRDLSDQRRRFNLSPEDLELLNPNTRTCPIFRTRTDAELTRKIYRRVPVLIRDDHPQGNPWGIRYSAMFHMSNDSELFYSSSSNDVLPLYEAKMVWHFDHRFTTYAGATQEQLNAGSLPQLTQEQKANASLRVLPRYWIAETEVLDRIAPPTDEERQAMADGSLSRTELERRQRARAPRWLMGFRDVTDSRNERSAVFSFLPYAAVGHTMPLIFANVEPELLLCLCGNLNSCVLDYIARQKIGGMHLTYNYLNQFAVFPPSFYKATDVAYVGSRVLELVYTADDMQPLADAIRASASPFAPTVPPTPYRWDESRRTYLRAELDAWFARAYGLTRDELRYILDPTDVYGSDFPSETFRVLKEKELAKFGEYRTRRLVLAAWDAQAAGDAQPVEIADASRTAVPAPEWMDRPLVLPALPRSRITPTLYRAAVVPHLVYQVGGKLSFDRFRRAYWLLTEPKTLQRYAKGEIGQEAVRWGKVFRDRLEKDMLIPHLRGAIRFDLQFIVVDGERWLQLRRAEHLSVDEHVIFDARLALWVAELWPSDELIAPLTADEESVIKELELAM